MRMMATKGRMEVIRNNTSIIFFVDESHLSPLESLAASK